MDESKFIEDIMCQNFSVGTYFDATRYIIIYAIISKEIVRTKVSFHEIANFIYDSYCDNPLISKRHANIEVQKIPKFGIEIIYKELELSLHEWMQDAPNGMLTFDTKNIIVNFNNIVLINRLKKIMPILFKKTFGIDFILPQNIESLAELNDEDVEIFGNSIFKLRGMREYQHCILCDDANFNELRAVRILMKNDGLMENECSNLNNILIMCKEHAIEYIQGKFKFDESGRVINILSSSVSKQMRIDIKYRTKERMDFVKRKLAII